MGILDAVLDMQKRWETSQRRMIPGSLGGRTDSASPAGGARAVAGPVIQRPQESGVVAYALYSGTSASATHNNSTIVPWDTLAEDSGSHGIVLSDPAGATPGRFTLPPGLYTVAAHIFFAPDATGFREIHFSGTVPITGNGALSIVPPKHRTAAVADITQGTDVALTAVIRSATGEDVLWVYGLQNSGGAINVSGRSIAFLRHS